MTNWFFIMRPIIDNLITIAYHWLSLLLILYLPMQNVKVIDNKNYTDLWFKYGPNI